ncbi:hypothetical protein [Williamsia sp. R60]
MKRLLLGLVGSAVLLLAACSTPDSEMTAEQYAELAKDVCQDAARDVLKDPNSADFRDVSATVVTEGEQWSVVGEVNANNSFGGKVGYQGFTCTANYTEDDDTMRASASLENG